LRGFDFPNARKEITSCPSPIHLIECSGECKKKTIIGTRYQCTHCKNFNFCARCYVEKGDSHHFGHGFMKIRTLFGMLNEIYWEIENDSRVMRRINEGDSLIQSVNDETKNNKKKDSMAYDMTSLAKKTKPRASLSKALSAKVDFFQKLSSSVSSIRSLSSSSRYEDLNDSGEEHSTTTKIGIPIKLETDSYSESKDKEKEKGEEKEKENGIIEVDTKKKQENIYFQKMPTTKILSPTNSYDVMEEEEEEEEDHLEKGGKSNDYKDDDISESDEEEEKEEKKPKDIKESKKDEGIILPTLKSGDSYRPALYSKYYELTYSEEVEKALNIIADSKEPEPPKESKET